MCNTFIQLVVCRGVVHRSGNRNGIMLIITHIPSVSDNCRIWFTNNSYLCYCVPRITCPVCVLLNISKMEHISRVNLGSNFKLWWVGKVTVYIDYTCTNFDDFKVSSQPSRQSLKWGLRHSFNLRHRMNKSCKCASLNWEHFFLIK